MVFLKRNFQECVKSCRNGQKSTIVYLHGIFLRRREIQASGELRTKKTIEIGAVVAETYLFVCRTTVNPLLPSKLFALMVVPFVYNDGTMYCKNLKRKKSIFNQEQCDWWKQKHCERYG